MRRPIWPAERLVEPASLKLNFDGDCGGSSRPQLPGLQLPALIRPQRQIDGSAPVRPARPLSGEGERTATSPPASDDPEADLSMPRYKGADEPAVLTVSPVAHRLEDFAASVR